MCTGRIKKKTSGITALKSKVKENICILFLYNNITRHVPKIKI